MWADQKSQMHFTAYGKAGNGNEMKIGNRNWNGSKTTNQLVLWGILQAQWFMPIAHAQGRYCARVSLIVVLTKHWLWSFSVAT